MDRFIDSDFLNTILFENVLKSNMDRFIVVPISSISTKVSRFKIQYG